MRVLRHCNLRNTRQVLSSSCTLTKGMSSSPDLQVFVPSHPLVKHWLAVARNRLSPPPIFRSALAELGRVLIYEAAHDWLPTIDGQVSSVCSEWKFERTQGATLDCLGPLWLLLPPIPCFA